MRVLILTITSGEGHNAIARAISDCLEGSCEVKMHDLYKGIKRTTAKIFNDGYLWICSKSLRVANGMYEIMVNRNPKRKKHSMARRLAKPGLPKLIEVIDDFKPDAIVCSHICAAILMSDLKRKGRCDIPVVAISNDYNVVPYCECATHVDYIISPCEFLNEGFLKKGFAQEQIKHFGSPANPKFSNHLDKTEARRQLGIAEDEFTVFVMNGGLGYGSTYEIVKNLMLSRNKFRIVAVNGNNKQTKEDIDKLIAETGATNITNFGFATNVDVIMSAADVLVGKMGGVSVTEALNKTLPILGIKKLPWQERYNMLLLTEKNICEHITDMDKIYEYVDAYIENPEILSKMRENIVKFARPDATTKVAELLLDLGKEYSIKKENA